MAALSKIEVDVQAVIGGRAMRLADVLRLRRGALLALDSPGPGRVALQVGGRRVGVGALEAAEGAALRVRMAGRQQ